MSQDQPPSSPLRKASDEARKLAGEYDELDIPGQDLSKVKGLSEKVLVQDKHLQEKLRGIEEDLAIEHYAEGTNRYILHYLVMANSLRQRIEKLYQERGDPKRIDALTRQLTDVNERIGFEFSSVHDVDFYLDYADRYLDYKESHPDVTVEDQGDREARMLRQLQRIRAALQRRVNVHEARMLLHLLRNEEYAGRRAEVETRFREELNGLGFAVPRRFTAAELENLDASLADAVEQSDRDLQMNVNYRNPELFPIDDLVYRWGSASREERDAIEREMQRKVEELKGSDDPDVKVAVQAMEQFLVSERVEADARNLHSSLPIAPFDGILLHADQLIAEVDRLQGGDPRASIEKRKELIPAVKNLITELMDRHTEAMLIAAGREHIVRRFAKDAGREVVVPSQPAEGLTEAMRSKAHMQISRMLGEINDMEEKTLKIGPSERGEEYWVKELRPRIVRLMRKLDWLFGDVEHPEDEKSTKDVIEEFDRTSMEKAKENLELASMLMSDEAFAPEKLPLAEADIPPEGARLTREDIENLRSAGPKERAQAWLILQGQIREDMEKLSEDKSNLIEEFARRGEVSDKAQQEFIDAGNRAQDVLGRSYLWIAIVLAAAGVLLADMALYTYTGFSVIKTGARAALGTARFAGRTAASAGRSASEAVRMAPRRMPKLSRGTAGHALFFAAEILTAAEIVRRYRIQLHMEKLPEQEGVDAALDLMQLHPNIDRDADRYESEVRSLVHRHELIDMREVIDRTIAGLESAGVSENEKPALAKTIKRGRDLRARIETQNRDLYWHFPLTDYIGRSTVDPPSVFRVLYHHLNEARARGVKEEKRPKGKLSDLLKLGRKHPGELLENAKPLAEEVEKSEELREMIREFQAFLAREEKAMKAAGLYARNDKIFEDLGREYEAWLKDVAVLK